jgi:hypothetical protein
MAAYRLSPQERAIMYARKVDHLSVRNRDYFPSHVETFKQEGRKKWEQEKDAEQPHFAPPVPPGSVAVEYWRPGPNPTPATMATLLAALHDVCLPDSPSILDLDCDTAGGALHIRQDPGLLALLGARVWCGEALGGATDRLDALKTYLDRATADIEAASQRADLKDEKIGGGAEPPAKPVAKRYERAFESYEWAATNRPDLAAKGRYSKALYDYVKDRWPGYGEDNPPCPPYETWTRYIRQHELLTTGRSNMARSGRLLGHNIVSQDAL